ncbi:hypothetical protein [Leptospirillum ferrooxidans]|jgi:hypothetical protein|uniref:hypothetical protein n=1 Tax=Leptospirillum ferrooxidans TaxID=180 RepID=UPI0002FC6A7B|nr:hypothetical protein [Leptospirillum ferrooxidans]
MPILLGIKVTDTQPKFAVIQMAPDDFLANWEFISKRLSIEITAPIHVVQRKIRDYSG